ncbi:uncharacterized protein LOC141721294 isoform X3 [Apium graveolens]|uniref:uncharacterized protein LOC141721294 isoform X3 n=1 Tax=Apium graveolens TaxID=4045 RepID=UPI003D79DDA0
MSSIPFRTNDKALHYSPISNVTTSLDGNNKPKRRGRGPSINTIQENNKENVTPTQSSIICSNYSIDQNIHTPFISMSCTTLDHEKTSNRDVVPPSENYQYITLVTLNKDNSRSRTQTQRRYHRYFHGQIFKYQYGKRLLLDDTSTISKNTVRADAPVGSATHNKRLNTSAVCKNS